MIHRHHHRLGSNDQDEMFPSQWLGLAAGAAVVEINLGIVYKILTYLNSVTLIQCPGIDFLFQNTLIGLLGI